MSLQSCHTFKFHHEAQLCVEITDVSQLKVLVHQGLEAPLVLGEGSNVIFTGDYEGHVLLNKLKGRDVIEEEDAYLIYLAGGESWSESVVWSIEQNMPGLENLALIPGSVGAAPVQNIGAYGVEFKDFCVAVHECDLVTGLCRRRLASDCDFGYRSSIYKHDTSRDVFITGVELRLPKIWSPTLSYGALQNLSDDATALEVMQEVIHIRQKKLPDPYVLGNAGSFFKNPIVSNAQFQDLIKTYPKLPFYDLGDSGYKLAAGWLIEHCGLEPMREGDIAVHTDQALVLVNLGQGHSDDLLKLAKRIQDRVHLMFHVALEPEVHFYQGRGVWYPL